MHSKILSQTIVTKGNVIYVNFKTRKVIGYDGWLELRKAKKIPFKQAK